MVALFDQSAVKKSKNSAPRRWRGEGDFDVDPSAWTTSNDEPDHHQIRSGTTRKAS